MYKINQINYLLFVFIISAQSCKILPQPLPIYDIAQSPDQMGWYDFINGKYQGELSNGVPNGKGVYIYKNGIRYEGDFSDGEIQGNGILSIPEYGVVKGTFQSGLIISGEIEYKNGNYFNGEFRNGKKYQGTFLGEDFSYSGRFESDLYVGNGLFIDYQKGIAYQGNYINGQKDGEWTEFSLNNETGTYKKYKNGVDLTNKLYEDLSVIEVENEFQIERKTLNTKFDYLEENLEIEKQKQLQINDSINDIDKNLVIDFLKMCACSIENETSFIDFCQKHKEESDIFYKCNCSHFNPFTRMPTLGSYYRDDNRTEAEKRRDERLAEERAKQQEEERKKSFDEYEIKFKNENLRMKPYCLSSLDNIEVLKKEKANELRVKFELYEKNLDKIREELKEREIENSLLSTRQTKEKPLKVQEQYKIIEKKYNEKATSEFKTFKSKLVNTPMGCSCGCIVLSPVRPDQEKMRGCPR